MMVVASETQLGVEYHVETNDGRSVCDCLGFLTHGRCKHLPDKPIPTLAPDAPYHHEPESDASNLARPDVPPLSLPGPLDDPARADTPLALPSPADMTHLANVARALCQADGMVPKGLKPAQALAVILRGWELGVPPMVALSHIFSINGRCEPDTLLMAALAKRRGYSCEYPEYTDEAVTCVLTAPSGQEISCRYTEEHARKSGQLKKPGPWQEYRRDMLAWSATKRALRLGGPECLT